MSRHCNVYFAHRINLQQLSAEDKGPRVDAAQLADEVVDLPGEQVHEGALLGRRTDRVHPGDARLQQRVLQPDGDQQSLDDRKVRPSE